MADGNIVAARTRLHRAVQRLTAPQTGMHHHRAVIGKSLYEELADSLPGTQGETRTPAKSLPPIWIDASMLRTRIDTQTRQWVKAPHQVSTTTRLTILSDRTWRPQDTDHVNDIAHTIDNWCDSICHLLDPEDRKYIAAACPSCGRQTVWHKDSAGELVRQPALRVVTNVGASCQHCGAHWAPDRYLWLCRVLGFTLPEGVLE